MPHPRLGIPWLQQPFRHHIPPYQLSSPQTSPDDDDDGVPFIPPDILSLDDSDTQPQIVTLAAANDPSQLLTIRAYRYRTSRQRWKHVPFPNEKEVAKMMENEQKKYPTTVRILTWNIDFMAPHPEARTKAALRHLERDVLGCKEGDAPFDPCCICLQEVHVNALPVILEDEWVRRHFVVTPGTADKWPMGTSYGNVTLVSRLLTIVRAEIMHYGCSEMARTALAVSILLSEPEPSAESLIICVVNTHLESMTEGITHRPQQLELASSFLKRDGIRGGVVAGDMNSISKEDYNLHMDVHLRDSWRKGDQEESGFTWGYQNQEPTRWPCGRLDKILYLPRRGYKMDPPERIGMGAKVMTDNGALWVSDHYGLDSTLRLVVRRNSQQSM